MNFKDIYKFPLESFEGLVYTFDYNRAFDFKFFNDREQELIVKALNGDYVIKKDLKLSYDKDESIIYSEISGKPTKAISIRGWGYLTGTGGLNLSEDVAVKIQDEFAEFIIKQLQP